MKATQKDVIRELSAITTRIVESATSYTLLDDSMLFERLAPQKWSMAECLEHLNLYGDFYIPVIRDFISEHSDVHPRRVFQSGFWGNYFAKSMKVNQAGTPAMKMKTFKDKNPIGMTIDRSVLERFIRQQENYLELLTLADRIDINLKGIPITITGLIRLRLGDALRFTIYHNERHWIQAERTQAELIKQKRGFIPAFYF